MDITRLVYIVTVCVQRWAIEQLLLCCHSLCQCDCHCNDQYNSALILGTTCFLMSKFICAAQHKSVRLKMAKWVALVRLVKKLVQNPEKCLSCTFFHYHHRRSTGYS